MNSNWSYSPETLNSGPNRYFVPYGLDIWWMTLENNKEPLLYYIKLCASFQIHRWTQTGVTVRKHSIRIKIGDFFVPRYFEISLMTFTNNRAHLLYYIKLCTQFQSHGWVQTGDTVRKRSIRVFFWSRVTLKFDRWPWKSIGLLSFAASSFVHHFIAIGKFKLGLQSGKSPIWVKIEGCSLETLNSDQNWWFFVPCDLEIGRMTLENNRAPLLSNIKLCASFHRHIWIQTGVTVQKRLSGVMTSATLNSDLWPWPFVWTSHLLSVITLENCRMIRWWKHSEKGVTDRRTDRQTDIRKRPCIEQLGGS